MSNESKKFANYEEKYLKSVIATADAGDSVMKLDGVEISYEEGRELFMKNLLVVEREGVCYRPIRMEDVSDQMVFTAFTVEISDVNAITFKTKTKA